MDADRGKTAEAAPERPEASLAMGQGAGEHFIPIRKSDVIRLLAAAMPESCDDSARFVEFCRLLEATLHHQYHRQLEQLKDAYSPFNPDAVTKVFALDGENDRAALTLRLMERARTILQRANYRRLTDEQIQEAIDTASEWGVRLRVDLSIFAHLEIYVRGNAIAHRTRRRWNNYYRRERVPVRTYQRLIVIFQLHESSSDTEEEPSRIDDPVHFKLFKNIPRQDVDMLLPGSRFRMSLLDHGKIVLPTVSGLVIAVMKVVKGALLAIFAGFWGIVAFLGFAGGTIGYGIKSFFEYLRTKDKYQLNLTRSLYYQNLDNNAGVLFRLMDEAEEQEFREAIVAYWLLLHHPAEGLVDVELDRQAEAWLAEALGFHVDFEVHDALEKLARLGCAVKTSSSHWKAVPLNDALLHMDEAWDRIFRHREVPLEDGPLEDGPLEDGPESTSRPATLPSEAARRRP